MPDSGKQSKPGFAGILGGSRTQTHHQHPSPKGEKEAQLTHEFSITCHAMFQPIQTARCILRELQPSDAPGMFELDTDPLVHRYLGNKPISTIEQATDVIAFVRRQYVENGIGRWALVHRESGAFMGWCGLKRNTEPLNGHVNYYDLGYRLMPRFWGQGYASEAGATALAFGFGSLKLQTIYAVAHIENAASNRVLTKLGFKQTGTFNYDEEPCYWYVCTTPQQSSDTP